MEVNYLPEKSGLKMKIRARASFDFRRTKFYQIPQRIEYSDFAHRVEEGIDIDAPVRNGDTALQVAICEKDKHLVKKFLQYGASINIKSKHFLRRDYTALPMAVLSGDYEILNLVLTEKPNFLIKSKQMHDTILGHAIRRRNFKLIKYLSRNQKIEGKKLRKLIQSEESAIDNLTGDGESALYLSINENKYGTKLFELLLDHGADINLVLPMKNSDGRIFKQSVIHIIADQGYRNFMELIIKNTEKYYVCKDMINENCLTALHLAVKNNNLELVKMLLDWNVDVNIKGHFSDYKIDFSFSTPLHWAVYFGNLEIIKILLTNKHVDVNAVSLNDVSIIYTAVDRKNIDVINCLLEYDIDIDYKNGVKGLTALHRAVFLGDKEVIDILLKYGADINTPTLDGMSLIHVAAMTPEITKSFIECCLDFGIDINEINCFSGNTALHYLADSPVPDLAAKVLLENGASINVLNNRGKSPLQLTLAAGETSLYKVNALLLNSGADANLVKKFPTNNELYSKLFLRHFIKLNVAGMYINKNSRFYLIFAFKVGEEKKFADDCYQEIERMRRDVICESSFISYYYYLIKKDNELMGYAANSDIVERFASAEVKEKYPIYGPMIVSSFERSLKLYNFIKVGKELLVDIFCHLPIAIAWKITSFLSINDLKMYRNYKAAI